MCFALTTQPGDWFRRSVKTSLLNKIFDKVSGRHSTPSEYGHQTGDLDFISNRHPLARRASPTTP